MDYTTKTVRFLHDLQWELIAAAQAVGFSTDDVDEIDEIETELDKRRQLARMRAGLKMD